MNRSEYWLRVILMFVALFVGGFFIGIVNNGLIPEPLGSLITIGSAIFMWVIGYMRCQDAGIHGAWAIFAPVLIGMIVLGCIRSKEGLV